MLKETENVVEAADALSASSEPTGGPTAVEEEALEGIEYYPPRSNERDEKGRFLPGRRSGAAPTPKIIGERRRQVIEYLLEGKSPTEAARLVNVDHSAVIRAMGRDEEVLNAAMEGLQRYRTMEAWRTQALATKLLDRIEDSIETAQGQELRALMVAYGIAVDKVRDLANIGAPPVAVRLAIGRDIIAAEVTASNARR